MNRRAPEGSSRWFSSAHDAYEKSQTCLDTSELVSSDIETRRHAEVVTAILDLMHEALQNPTAACLAALTHSSLVSAVMSVFRNRDYRYLQTLVSALRLLSVLYDNCTSSLRTVLQELDAVGQTGARTRYEVAKVKELILNIQNTNVLTDMSPWEPQSKYGKEELQAVLANLTRGQGVPCFWDGKTDLKVAYFWQAMEEMANRRCLLMGLIKEGPVFHFYLNGRGIEASAGLADVFVRNFSLAYR